jgi:Pvc16 N-terminal domain
MTAQHQIIKETTDTLVDLLETTYKDNGYKRVHIIVEAPKPDAIEGKLPAICLYLYQIGPDWDGVPLSDAYDGVKRMRTPEGKVIEVHQRAPNWVRLDYLISTWAQTPEDEQLLLGLAIKCVSETNYLEGEALKGESFPQDFYLPISTTGRLEEGTLARFWGSLNQPIRPALQIWTVIPIMSDVVSPFKRVEERVIGYRRLGVRGGDSDELELGPERRPDMPPDGVFVERKK